MRERVLTNWRPAAIVVLAVIFGAVAVFTVSASAGTEQQGAQGGAAQPAEAERPVLRIAVESIPDDFAPSENVSNVGQRVNYSIFDHFIKRAYWETPDGDGGNLVPSVAESWTQISPTVWEIKIREGVKFHNGEEVTADDVAFNFSEERMFGADRMVARGTQYFGTLKSVEEVGAYTVRFETVAPDPAFVKRFTSPLAFVVPKDYYLEKGIDEFGLAPIGTGPYRLAEFKQGEFVRLEAFDDYWGGTPPAREVIFYEIPEFAGRVTALFNGEVDLIANITPDQLDLIQSREGFTLLPVMIENNRQLVFNTLAPGIEDNRLRKALAYAVDRDLIVDQLWMGYSRVPRTLNFPAHGDLYLTDRPKISYDPALSRQLLQEVGYNGEELILRVNGTYYANYLEAAQIMQEMWKDVGINVSIEVREGSSLYEGLYHMRAWSVGMQVNDILFPIWTDYGPSGPRTAEGDARRVWIPPEDYLALGLRLNTTMDPAERREIFRSMVEIVEDEMVELPLFQATEFYAIRDGIDWQPYSFWMMDFSAQNLSFIE